jgi:hypothetical protein
MDIQSPGRDLNQGTPKHKSPVLTIRLRRSVVNALFAELLNVKVRGTRGATVFLN